MTTGYEVKFYRDVERIADSLHELSRMERDPVRIDLGDGFDVTVNPQLHEPINEVASKIDALTEVMGEVLQVNARIADALEFLAGQSDAEYEFTPGRGIEDVPLPEVKEKEE